MHIHMYTDLVIGKSLVIVRSRIRAVYQKYTREHSYIPEGVARGNMRNVRVDL